MIASEGGRRIRDDDIVVDANDRRTVASGSTDKGACFGSAAVAVVMGETRALTGSPPTEVDEDTAI